MTKKADEERAALDRLADALVEDIFDASDEEVLSELADTGDPAKDAEAMKELFESALLKANKKRLAAAKAGAAAARDPLMRVASTVTDIESARARIRALTGAVDLPQPVTLAARNEAELSDADILSMYEDLVELGMLPPTEPHD